MRTLRWATTTVAMGAALALPATAAAGGFATVGLSSLPDGTAPGTSWHVTLTILQHGRTPLSGLAPTVIVRSADGTLTRTFAARPAGRAGRYTADVVFPAAGRWQYSVDDGFSQTHTFAPVAIGSSRAPATVAATSVERNADTGGPDVAAALGAAAAAGLLAALLAAVLVRGRPDAAPAAR